MQVKVSENSTIRYRNIVSNQELYDFAIGLHEQLDDAGCASLDKFINSQYGTWQHEQGNKTYTLTVEAKEGDLVEVDFTFARSYKKKETA